MPSVHPPCKVLVTGASGFIGAWTVRVFLERGYDVRGTVRSTSKGEWLASQEWAKAGPAKFEYVVVEDVEAAGAFDEAVKNGVAVVAHTASPVTFTPGMDPSDIINPAVNGTLGILNSTLKYGSAVKRVVVTSSVGAILEPSEELRVFTEEDWNDMSVREVETKGAGAAPIHMYRTSKVKAEKAVWAFVEQYKEELNFELTTILPPFVYGPIIHDVPSFNKLNLSVKLFYDNVRVEAPLDSLVGNGNYVDVRDVAAMHVDVVENEKAAGERFIVNGGLHTWQDVYDALNAHANPIAGIPVGTPGAGKNVFRPWIFSNEKAKKVLGTKFIPLEKMSYDTIASLKERGFW